jgi:hypothetical protein
LDLTGREVTVVEDDEAFVPVRGLSRRARVEEQEGKDGERSHQARVLEQGERLL